VINYPERVKEEIKQKCVSIYNKKFEGTKNENNKKNRRSEVMWNFDDGNK
jgi:hypothetical protein